MRTSMQCIFLAILSISLLAGCNSTSVVAQWSETVAERKPLSKVLVCTPLVSDAATRRMVEDRMAAAFPSSVKAVPSYTIFPDPAVIRMENKEKIAQQLQQAGFDSALVAAVDSTTRREVYVPPTVYTTGGGFYGYNRFGYGGGFYPNVHTTPGYTYEEKKYLIEIVLFSIPDGKMAWTMTTESVNPNSREQLVTELNTIINNDLKEDGFIAQ